MNTPEFTQLAEGAFTINHFLSPEECRNWIDFSEARGYEVAKIGMGQRQVLNQQVRNNERVIFDDTRLAESMWERLKSYIPNEHGDLLKNGLNERWRIYKYQAGQRFLPHQDGSYIRNINEWSVYTFMIYLNEDMEGGQTNFRSCSVRPETGKALIFSHQLMHEGVAVEAGLKYVLRTDVMFKRKKRVVLAD